MIARRVGPVALDGVEARTLEAFCRAFALEVANGRLAVADLSLGAWQSHQVATEFSSQLGLDLPVAADVEPTPAAIAERSFADVIGAFIDVEGRGDATTLVALERAMSIARVGRERVFAVVAPRFGLTWEREDVLLVRFLTQALAGHAGRVVVVGVDPQPPVPTDWHMSWSSQSGPSEGGGERQGSLLGLVPGIVSLELAQAVSLVEAPSPERLLALDYGYHFIAPEARRDPRGVSRFEYDKLALATRPGGWTHAYAQLHGNNFFVDPWFLWGQAYREVEGGGYSLALRLAERAAECARDPLQLGVVQSLAQGVRIASHRFVEASHAPEPPPGVPPAIRGFLLEAKGWALAMIDEPDLAEPYLQEARALSEQTGTADREYLYLLNISALNRLKLDDADSALAFEKEIEAAQAGSSHRDWRLQYVNSLNIARLARRRGAYEEAEGYYRRAFEGTLGSRSDGDRIYANVCLARVDEDRGEVAGAFRGWMRAALHWVAAAAPEAVASRVATAIVERNVAPGETDPEEISAAFEARLARAARAMGFSDPPAQETAPVFVHVDRVEAPTLDAAVLGDGWSVLTTEHQARPALQSDELVRLGRLLRDLIDAACPVDVLRRTRSIVIDDCFGTEVPTTLAQLMALAVRLRIEAVVAHGQTIELDRETRARLERDLRVRLGPAVDEVLRDDDRVVVTFKRYLSPRLLSEDEVQIIGLLSLPQTVAQIGERVLDGELPHARLLELVRVLELSRVVTLELPSDSLRRAGLLVAMDGHVAR